MSETKQSRCAFNLTRASSRASTGARTGTPSPSTSRSWRATRARARARARVSRPRRALTRATSCTTRATRGRSCAPSSSRTAARRSRGSATADHTIKRVLGAAALGEKYYAAEVLHHVHQAHGGLGAREPPPMLQLRLKHFDDTRGARVAGREPHGARRGARRRRLPLPAQRRHDPREQGLARDAHRRSRGLGAAAEPRRRGPTLDTNNARILTHAFVHRTHVELFGCFFPVAFKNWWSDDWISAVYGSSATFARRDVVVTHNVQSQKLGAFNRASPLRASACSRSARASLLARARARASRPRANEPRRAPRARTST